MQQLLVCCWCTLARSDPVHVYKQKAMGTKYLTDLASFGQLDYILIVKHTLYKYMYMYVCIRGRAAYMYVR